MSTTTMRTIATIAAQAALAVAVLLPIVTGLSIGGPSSAFTLLTYSTPSLILAVLAMIGFHRYGHVALACGTIACCAAPVFACYVIRTASGAEPVIVPLWFVIGIPYSFGVLTTCVRISGVTRSNLV